MGATTVSIGLPVYNGADTIEDCLRSLQAQTHEDLEIVVSDNASTDGTAEICRSVAAEDDRITVHENPENLGATANFNRVFELSSAPWFKWIGHDDVLEPETIETALRAGQRRPDAAIVYWLERMTDEQGRTLRQYTPDQAFEVAAPEPGRRFRQMLWWKQRGLGGDPIYGLIRSAALRSTRLLSNGMNPNFLLLQELALVGNFHTIPEVFAHRVYNDIRTTAPRLLRWLDPNRPLGRPHFWRAREYYGLVVGHDDMWPTDRLATLASLTLYHLRPNELRGFAWDLLRAGRTHH